MWRDLASVTPILVLERVAFAFPDVVAEKEGEVGSNRRENSEPTWRR